MLGIETRLLTVFHLQTDGQMEQINQELEQYLRFFVDHRQKNWPEWLALAEFAVNNKVHTTTKVSPFMANYGRELRIGRDIRKKRKVESRKWGGVCRKDEKGARGSRSSAEEGTRRYEETSRSEKERDRELEKER